MIAWLAFYVALSACFVPLFRLLFVLPALLVPPAVAGEVPNATYDFGGLV